MPAFTRSELADLNVFMTIVRRRSFRHSAQELGVSTSALSHSMRNLEARLGVKLLNRTSRSVVPTDAGSALAAKLEDGFQLIGEALGELDAYRTPWTALAWPTAWKWESPRSCVAAGCNWYCPTGPRWARRSASIIRADASRNPACAN